MAAISGELLFSMVVIAEAVEVAVALLLKLPVYDYGSEG